jgi:glycosyltransferase involved in cell wall biosynthesis
MKIAVIIPCYKVKEHIVELLQKLTMYDYQIYVIDDKCPENSGKIVEQTIKHPLVKVIYNDKNLGVGGAVKRGYQEALKDGCEVFVKLDGDGQMDPKLISGLISPILRKETDVSKGNRFYNINTVIKMPFLRLFGNSALSFINKMVNGYWKIMDPTNGFIAIHKSALLLLPLNKIDNRYFFESDLLFRLGTIRAVVQDFSMDAKYANEKSGLSIWKVLFEFPPKYLTRFIKRIFYTYFIRDFNVGTIELIFGNILVFFGIIFGGIKWFIGVREQIVTPTGTVMIAVLPIILGFQLILSFINYDINNAPTKPLNTVD